MKNQHMDLTYITEKKGYGEMGQQCWKLVKVKWKKKYIKLELNWEVNI